VAASSHKGGRVKPWDDDAALAAAEEVSHAKERCIGVILADVLTPTKALVQPIDCVVRIHEVLSHDASSAPVVLVCFSYGMGRRGGGGAPI